MDNEISKAIKRKTDAQMRMNATDITPVVNEGVGNTTIINDPSKYIIPMVAGQNVTIGTSGSNKVINALMNILAGDNITVSAPDENGAVTISSSGGGSSNSTLYTASGAISLEDGFATFDSTGGSMVMSLADGTPGQEVILKKVAGAADVTIAPTNFFDGQSLTLVKPRDSAILRFSGSHWHHVANFNATISESMEKLITIDHTKITSDLTNYPVMVNLSGKIPLPVDSSAVYFTDMSDVDLEFEREYYDSTTQKAVYHVKIPTVSSVSDTQFKVKWDGVVDKENKTAVWDSDFVLVQHMGESLLDSTANAKDMTNYGTEVVEGLNGTARSFNGTNNYMSSGGTTPLYSHQTLLYLPTTIISSSAYNIYAQPDIATGWIGFGQVTATISNEILSLHGGSNRFRFTTTSIPAGWHLIDLRYNGSAYEFYVDGILHSMSTYGSAIPVLTAPFIIGKSFGDHFNGKIEEFRVSKIARSASWIKADDHNLRLNDLITI